MGLVQVQQPRSKLLGGLVAGSEHTLILYHNNRPASVRMTGVPSNMYTRQLFPKEDGMPLFIPKPYDNLHPDYREPHRYQSSQRSILAHHGTQPAMVPNSSSKAKTNEPPYLSTSSMSSRHDESSARGPAANVDSDPSSMHLDHPASRRAVVSPNSDYSTARARNKQYHHPHQHSSLTAPLDISAASPPRHSSLNLSAGTQAVNVIPYRSIPSYPNINFSASPAPVRISRTALRPRVSTMQMKSNSLQVVDDPESRSTFYSLIGSSGDKDMNGFPPSRSPSRSTSSSDSSSQASSFPNGMGITVPSSNSVSDSSAGGAGPRKNKMHQCAVCGKSFPRPSGLDTHTNSHTGAKRTSTLINSIY